eukprot:GHVS01019707.1.p1 GENE.GHVS01019707.1~~GHVS01019707.1.p1  ORF type:complete len:506 (-),score=82.48 GHVS01019707.1:104-1621(-)
MFVQMCKRMGPLECLVSPRFDSATPALGSVYLMLNIPANHQNSKENTTSGGTSKKNRGDAATDGSSSPTICGRLDAEGQTPSVIKTTSAASAGVNGSSQKSGTECFDVASSIDKKEKWLQSPFGLYFSCTSGHLVRFQLEVSGRKGDYRLLNSWQTSWEGFSSFALFGDVWDPVADSITIVASVIEMYPPNPLSPHSNFHTPTDRPRSWSSAAALPSNMTCPLSPLSIPSPPLFSATSFQHPGHSPASPSVLHASSPPHPRPLPSPAFSSSPLCDTSMYRSPSSWQPPVCPSNRPKPIGRPPPPPLRSSSPLLSPHAHSPPASPPPGFEPLLHCLPSGTFSPQRQGSAILSSSSSSWSPHCPPPSTSMCRGPPSPLITLLPAGHTSYCPPSPPLNASPLGGVATKNDLSLEVVYRMLRAGCECEEKSERERHFQLAVVAAEYNSDCIYIGVQRLLVHPKLGDKQLSESLCKILQRDFLPILRDHNLTDALSLCQGLMTEVPKTSC